MGRVCTYKNWSPDNPLVQYMFDAQSCVQVVTVYRWSIGPQGRPEDEGDPERRTTEDIMLTIEVKFSSRH